MVAARLRLPARPEGRAPCEQSRDPVGRMGEARMSGPYRLAEGGAIDRTGARLHLRRPALSRASRRHARLGTAGEWRAPRGAIVQISPPARLLLGRPGGAERPRNAANGRTAGGQCPGDDGGIVRRPGCGEPEPLAHARIRSGRRQRHPRAVPAGGLLLQDLHVAGSGLGAVLRAFDPARCGPRPDRPKPIPTVTRRSTPIARRWSSAAGGPGAGRPGEAARMGRAGDPGGAGFRADRGQWAGGRPRSTAPR